MYQTTTACRRGLLILYGVLSALPQMGWGGTTTVNVTVTVTVNETACSLDPADAVIPLDFGSVIDRDLQLHTRISGKPLQIHLQNCSDTVQYASVTLRPSRQASDGLIATNLSGIAVGLETTDALAKPVPVDGTTATSFRLDVAGGKSVIPLKAYVKAISPDFHYGPFQASADFTLSYP